MLRLILKYRHIETKAVATAAEALSAVQEEQFDLYLLDAWLPDLDGFELCRRLREFDQKTPIVFYSAAAYEADRRRGVDAGGNAYVIKPDINGLLGSVTQFVSRAQRQAVPVKMPTYLGLSNLTLRTSR